MCFCILIALMLQYMVEDFRTYNKLLLNLNAKGAAGSMIVSHAFLILTSRSSLRLIFLDDDLGPRVATSLEMH
jgi:hypothetical protein